jgi:hypothetical protein
MLYNWRGYDIIRITRVTVTRPGSLQVTRDTRSDRVDLRLAAPDSLDQRTAYAHHVSIEHGLRYPSDQHVHAVPGEPWDMGASAGSAYVYAPQYNQYLQYNDTVQPQTGTCHNSLAVLLGLGAPALPTAAAGTPSPGLLRHPFGKGHLPLTSWQVQRCQA